MVLSLRRVKKWVQFYLLFVLFTLLLYQVLTFVVPLWQEELLTPKPKGEGAVKVFAQSDAETFFNHARKRLHLFYLLGE